MKHSSKIQPTIHLRIILYTLKFHLHNNLNVIFKFIVNLSFIFWYNLNQRVSLFDADSHMFLNEFIWKYSTCTYLFVCADKGRFVCNLSQSPFTVTVCVMPLPFRSQQHQNQQSLPGGSSLFVGGGRWYTLPSKAVITLKSKMAALGNGSTGQ